MQNIYSCTVLYAPVLEKLPKAHWVKDNHDNHPPRTHNLIKLSSQINFKLTEDFQLEGRYPDYT